MPLAMALRYHSLVDTLQVGRSARDDTPTEMNALDAIPGHVNDRDSVSLCSHTITGPLELIRGEPIMQPLGDLNWLFVNIVETIAWQSLPTEAFRTLFRTGRALRALARGYILA